MDGATGSVLARYRIPYGSTTLTEIEEINWVEGQGDVPELGSSVVIPDGAGGALAAWTRTEPEEYHIARITSGGVSDFTLPSTWGQPVEEMVLGEDGIAYATNLVDLVALDIASGQTVWSYEIPQEYPYGVRIMASTAAGGLVTTLRALNGSDYTDTVVRFDDAGVPTTDSWTAGILQYDVSGLWLGRSPSALSLYAAELFAVRAGWSSPDQSATRADTGTVTVDPVSQSGTEQNTIADVLLRIENALPSFSGCNNWLQGGQSYINTLRTGGYFAHGTVRRNGRISYMNGAFVAGVGSGAPESAAIVVNDVGPFFKMFENGDLNKPLSYGPKEASYAGNSSSARIAILLHEVAHGVVVIPDDGKDPDVEVSNTRKVVEQCRALIEGPEIKTLSPNSGPVSTTVTIMGKGFGDSQGNSTVTFHNGVLATPSSWDDDEIVVTVPAQATTGDVTVRIGGSSGLSASKNFTVQ